MVLALVVCVSGQLFMDEEYYHGYLHVEKGEQPTELYYLLFKSRDKNPNAPLIWFFEGGPGMSSLHAVFYQNGPFRLNKDMTLSKNEFSFNNIADVLYVDQPLGTGYSNCTDKSLFPHDESVIAEDLISFFHNFLEEHKEYRGRPMYLVSQSYGSHFVLPLARTFIENGVRYANIKGVAMGNAWIRPELQLTTLASFTKRSNLTTEFKYIASMYGYIIASIFIDLDLDEQAYDLTEMATGVLVGIHNHQFNRYDTRIRCAIGVCNYNWTELTNFLRREDVRRTLGVGERPFNLTSSIIFRHLLEKNEYFSDKSDSLIQLLDDYTLPVYIFSGMDDWWINTFGMDTFMDSLHWSHREELKAKKWMDWYSNGELRGRYKRVANLVYAHVKDAGHYVAMDQPAFAQDLIVRMVYGAL